MNLITDKGSAYHAEDLRKNWFGFGYNEVSRYG